jgi:hypothetical protein
LTGTPARWAAVFGVAAVLSVWLPPAAAAQAAGCTILQAETERDGGPTTLRLLSLPDGVTQRVTRTGFWINAMGYSAGQGVVYGVADGTRGGRYHGAHAVRIDAAGEVTDLGVIGRAGARHSVWSLVTGATAGTIAGTRWYVRQDGDLYTVDTDPASADYLRVVHRTALRPVSLAIGVDDFAYDAADGLLYGVSASSRGGNSVVTLDPGSGRVEVVPGLRFPEGGSYGSVALTADTIYATANHDGGRSVTYRLPRDGSGQPEAVAAGPALASSDAAGCYPGAPSPPPIPPPPPPQEPPPNPPPRGDRPSPAPQSPLPGTQQPPPPAGPPSSPTSSPTSPGAQPVVVPPTVPGATPPPASRHARTPDKPVAVVTGTGLTTEAKRRWGVTALILVLGGGAAVAHVRRHR